MKKLEEFLTHYGILGMRWGVRRPVGSDGLVNPKSSGSIRLSQVSDDELKRIISRMQMEKQYKELTKNNSKLKIGTAIVGGILLTAGKSVAQEYVTKLLKQKLNLPSDKK